MTLTTALLRASLLVAGSAVLVALLLRITRLRCSRLRRAGWSLVLIQGVMLAPWSLSVPWYETAAPAPRLAAGDALADLSAAGTPVGLAAATGMAPAAFDGPRWSWKLLALRVWAGGAMLVLGAMGGAYLLLLREARRTAPAPESWQGELDETLDECGLPKRLPLRVHGAIGPLLCRLPRGAQVIVPGERWAQLTRDERCAVLRHEAMHWRRGDVWKSLLARLLVVPHWFNPAAWWAAGRFDESAEWACDEQMAREAPHQAPVLARALLHFTGPGECSPLAAAANGAPLCTRLRRLLQPPENKDSVMKRGMILAALAALAVAGAIRVKLVARENQDEAPASEVDAAFSQGIAQLARQLPDEGDLGKLRAALGTKEGQLVMRGHSDRYVHEAREQAQNRAVPMFLEKHFEKSSQGYQLRDDQQAFRDSLLKSAGEVNTDIEKVSAALRQLSEKIEADTEASKLLVRFMSEDAGAVMLYVQELRKRIRPSLEVIEYRLRELVVRNNEGKYVIREGRRDDAERLVGRAEKVVQLQATIARELAAWSKDVAEVDDLHRTIKQSFSDPAFAVFVSHKTMDGDGEINEQALVNKLLDGIDDATEDVAAGLVVRDQAREEVTELIAKFQKTKSAVEAIRPLMQEFAGHIDLRDPLHKRWAKVLDSDLIAVKLGEEIGEQGAMDVGAAIRDLLGEVVTDAGNGRYRLAEDREEQITEHIQNAFREYRKLVRRLRGVDRLAEQIADPQLKQALSSSGGKFTVAMMVERDIRSQQVNGLARWADDFLEKTADGGYGLTEAGREEVSAMLQEIEQVRKELKNDDF